jgi:hypothetical protein
MTMRASQAEKGGKKLDADVGFDLNVSCGTK